MRYGMGCLEGNQTSASLIPLLQKLQGTRPVQESPKAMHCKSQTQDVESAPTAPTRCLTFTSYHTLHLDSCPNTVTMDGAGAYTVFFSTVYWR